MTWVMVIAEMESALQRSYSIQNFKRRRLSVAEGGIFTLRRWASRDCSSMSKSLGASAWQARRASLTLSGTMEITDAGSASSKIVISSLRSGKNVDCCISGIPSWNMWDVMLRCDRRGLSRWFLGNVWGTIQTPRGHTSPPPAIIVTYVYNFYTAQPFDTCIKLTHKQNFVV